MTKFMRAGAIEAFRKRAAYYVSQPGFCQLWLAEAAHETISAILDLAPLRFAMSSAFQEHVPAISNELRTALESEIRAVRRSDDQPAGRGVRQIAQAEATTGREDGSGDRQADIASVIPEPATPENQFRKTGEISQIAYAGKSVVLGTAKGAQSSSAEERERAKLRTAWLDNRLATHESWSSLNEIVQNGGPTYNTIQRYRSGVLSTREAYVRKKFAIAFECDIEEVPE
jgi:hypothetical protein